MKYDLKSSEPSIFDADVELKARLEGMADGPTHSQGVTIAAAILLIGRVLAGQEQSKQ
jgi:hypothetical protein